MAVRHSPFFCRLPFNSIGLSSRTQEMLPWKRKTRWETQTICTLGRSAENGPTLPTSWDWCSSPVRNDDKWWYDYWAFIIISKTTFQNRNKQKKEVEFPFYFPVVLGITLATMKERGKPLLDFFTCLSEAMMLITTCVIYLAPVGVFFLIGGQILEMEDMSMVAGQLGYYFMTVLTGLFIHGFIVLPIIYSACTKKLPFKFVANMFNAFTTAFGTASSSATLPVTINLLEEKNGVDSRIARYQKQRAAPIQALNIFIYTTKSLSGGVCISIPFLLPCKSLSIMAPIHPSISFSGLEGSIHYLSSLSLARKQAQSCLEEVMRLWENTVLFGHTTFLRPG